MYEYAATVERVLDGDTYVLRVDLGWHVSIQGHVRLIGVDCPEQRAPGGQAATEWVTALLAEHAGRIVVRTVAVDPARSFARYLAHVDLGGADLAELIIEAGHGVPRT